jgi:hypothetical protein
MAQKNRECFKCFKIKITVFYVLALMALIYVKALLAVRLEADCPKNQIITCQTDDFSFGETFQNQISTLLFKIFKALKK